MVAQQMLGKLIANSDRGKAGLIDRYGPHRQRPIREHVADYRQDMMNREITALQVQMVHSRLLRIIELAELQTIGDISPAKVQAVVAHLRSKQRSVQTCNFYIQAMEAILPLACA